MRELVLAEIGEIQATHAESPRIAYVLPSSIVLKAGRGGVSGWQGMLNLRTWRALRETGIPIIDLRDAHDPKRLLEAMPPISWDAGAGAFIFGRGHRTATIEATAAVAERLGASTANVERMNLHPGMFQEPPPWEDKAYDLLESGDVAGAIRSASGSKGDTPVWEIPGDPRVKSHQQCLDKIQEHLCFLAAMKAEGSMSDLAKRALQPELRAQFAAKMLTEIRNVVVYEAHKTAADNYGREDQVRAALVHAIEGAGQLRWSEYSRYLGDPDYPGITYGIEEMAQQVRGLISALEKDQAPEASMEP